MSEVQSLLNCCQTSGSEDKVMRSCQSMIVMRQLSQQQSLGSEDLKVNDWSRQITWPEYSSLIGLYWSHDLMLTCDWLIWQDVNAAIKNGDHDGVIRAIQKQKFPLWKCVNEDSDQQISGTGDCHCFPIRLMSLKLTFYFNQNQTNIRQAFILITHILFYWRNMAWEQSPYSGHRTLMRKLLEDMVNGNKVKMLITWPEYWPMRGKNRPRNLKTGLLLLFTHHVT